MKTVDIAMKRLTKLCLYHVGFVFAPALYGQSYDELLSLYVAEEYVALLTVLDEPESMAQWKLRGDALQKTAQFEQALEAYYMSEAEGNADAELYLHRAICRFALEHYDAALDDLENARRFGSTDVRLSYYEAALAFVNNDPSLCLHYIAEAVEANPNYFDAHYLAGALFYDEGQTKEAERAFLRCAQLNPAHERTQLNLAMVHIDQLRYGKAIDRLSPLLNSEDEAVVSEAYYQRGICRYETRDRTGACEDWANAADLGDADAKVLISGVCQSSKKQRLSRKSIYVAF
jgi:tetratricopeptide (TPR) repeat protein